MVPGLGQRGVEGDGVVADGEQEPVAVGPVRVLGPVAELVGVDHGEHVGDAERLADVALALHLAHVQRVAADAVGGRPDASVDAGAHAFSFFWSSSGSGRARVALEGGDLVALGAAPGLAGHEGGDQAEQAVGGEQQGRADPADAREQRGGDERGEAGDDGGELVGQRGAGGAGLGGEQLGEPGALHAGEGVLADRVADDERDDDRDRGAGVDHEEQRHAPGDGERGAEQVDRAAADAVGERAPQDGGDDAERGRDHQRGQGGRAVGQLLARRGRTG